MLSTYRNTAYAGGHHIALYVEDGKATLTDTLANTDGNKPKVVGEQSFPTVSAAKKEREAMLSGYRAQGVSK